MSFKATEAEHGKRTGSAAGGDLRGAGGGWAGRLSVGHRHSDVQVVMRKKNKTAWVVTRLEIN